jgi:hypothetical protein
MMKIKSEELIEQLQADTRQLILMAGYLKSEDMGLLTRQPAPEQWSVAQVLEHLNSYGNYYLPAIRKSLAASEAPSKLWFRSGWLGQYFTRLMQPGEDGVIAKKMKAPKGHRPVASLNASAVIDTFLAQQHELLGLLKIAASRDMGKIRTPISISRLVKLKVGDTFRFLIAHEQRHFIQVGNTLAQVRRGATRMAKAS